MNRALWDTYRAAPPGVKRQKLLAKLLEDEDGLAQQQVAKFVAGTRYYVGAMREDILQAARIGILRAIDKWNPAKGAFSTIAGYWCRHEMQEVLQHASPITHPRKADLPRRTQEAADAFYARHGREPDPQEIGVTPAAADRAQAASMRFIHLNLYEFPSDEEDSPEETLDRNRDMRALKRFMLRLTPQEKRDFWAGKAPALVADAKRYVEGRRGLRALRGAK